MIKYMLKDYESKLGTLLVDLNKLNNDVVTDINFAHVKRDYDHVFHDVDQHCIKIVNRKVRKLERDLNEYKNGIAYQPAHKLNYNTNNRFNRVDNVDNIDSPADGPRRSERLAQKSNSNARNGQQVFQFPPGRTNNRGPFYQQRSWVPRSVCSEPCPSGYRKAARVGQPICCFDCVPCSMGEITNQTDLDDCIKCSEFLWSDVKREKCLPKVIDFLAFEDSLGASLAGLAVVGSFVTVSVLCIFVKFQDTPVVKANNQELSYILLISLTLCFLCSLIFIGHPMRTTCLLRQPAFGIVFSVCISSVLAKTVIVVIAFNATKPSSNLKNRVGSRKIPSSIIVSSSMLQIIICIIWLSSATPYPQNNMNSVPGKIITECNEGSAVMFYCMLGYLGLLAGICFVVAFLARNLPDRFNEAKYITFSMFVFISVWLSFIPAYLSTRGKNTIAVEIFAILTSSAGLLVCIFIPKCYIILLRPDMNLKEKVTGK
ncbi:vomeronasal type-2 receptor 26-like [Protopterus annectens]|uniref:vomeronasal type-2 receptor 26-like n=1 Tax=Protopterus annectens TaxID=7888 RepID=UPI001CF9E672|nr:vomeronasal type-2 receptor 26-like [Protopterus annectens]